VALPCWSRFFVARDCYATSHGGGRQPSSPRFGTSDLWPLADLIPGHGKDAPALRPFVPTTDFASCFPENSRPPSSADGHQIRNGSEEDHWDPRQLINASACEIEST
jgi:hypothetical protein